MPLLRTPLQGPYAAMYGSDRVAARYCGLGAPPAPPRGLWMHGWYPEARELDRPERLFDVSMAGLHDLCYWVTTERQAAFLRGLGYPHAKAIGLPLAYVPAPPVDREENSLLVMPAHSLPANDRSWATSDYVQAIRALRPAFRTIVICIGGHDWDRGNWVQEFRAAGFDVIRGAGDASSLERMASLFSRFDYVTTNGFGSLIAYASAFGAKASFYGPFSEVTADTLKNVPFFIDNPELIAPECECLQETYCREKFPEFFRHPTEAEERLAWGRRELGWQHRVPPDELRGLFGWSALGAARANAMHLVGRVRARIPDPVKTEIRAALTREGSSTRRERRRLSSMGRGVQGTTRLFGASFGFLDAASYLDELDAWFVRESYRFRATSERPLVIDANAGVGVGVLYSKCLYPRSRILALETDAATFAQLERNRRVYGLEDVVLVRDGPGGELAARALATLRSKHADGEGPSAPTPSPTEERPGGAIDLLRACIGPAHPATVDELRPLLATTESVALDYVGPTGEPQVLSEILAALQDAGFRIAVQSPDSARRAPLIEIPSSGERDTRLRVLGFRM